MGQHLIRVRYFEGADPAEIRWALEALGCSSEHDASRRLIAVEVPPAASLADVQSLLAQGCADERWDYEGPILRE